MEAADDAGERGGVSMSEMVGVVAVVVAPVGESGIEMIASFFDIVETSQG